MAVDCYHLYLRLHRLMDTAASAHAAVSVSVKSLFNMLKSLFRMLTSLFGSSKKGSWPLPDTGNYIKKAQKHSPTLR